LLEELFSSSGVIFFSFFLSSLDFEILIPARSEIDTLFGWFCFCVRESATFELNLGKKNHTLWLDG
jgi:hypothetical protein